MKVPLKIRATSINAEKVRTFFLGTTELQEKYQIAKAAKKIPMKTHANGGAAITIRISASHAARFLSLASVYCPVNSDKTRTARNKAAPE